MQAIRIFGSFWRRQWLLCSRYYICFPAAFNVNKLNDKFSLFLGGWGLLNYRTPLSFQRTETEDSMVRKRNSSKHSSLRQPSTSETCLFTLLKNKFMSFSLEPVKSKKLLWALTRTLKRLAAFALSCNSLFFCFPPLNHVNIYFKALNWLLGVCFLHQVLF